MKRTSWYSAAVAVVAALIGLSGSAKSHAQDGVYDCVLESKSTIELQSAEDGILDHVLVQRGDRVTKNAVVARLDSKQEALIAERARIRAAGETGVRSAQAQAEYRRKEFERMADLKDSNSIPQREFATAEVESRLADIAVDTAVMEQ